MYSNSYDFNSNYNANGNDHYVDYSNSVSENTNQILENNNYDSYSNSKSSINSPPSNSSFYNWSNYYSSYQTPYSSSMPYNYYYNNYSAYTNAQQNYMSYGDSYQSYDASDASQAVSSDLSSSFNSVPTYNNYLSSPYASTSYYQSNESSNYANNHSTPLVTKNQDSEIEYSNRRDQTNIARRLLSEQDDETEQNENKPSKSTKKPRIRTAFSTEQRRYLLSVFEQTIYPTKEILETLANELNVTTSVIQTWFKNTRSKLKKLTHTKNL